MNFLIDNWYVLLAVFVLGIVIGDMIIVFFKMPRESQIANVKEWLKMAVVEAEKELGEKTGALKLRYVYDMFVDRFGWLAKVITFDQFSAYVDDALIWMRVQLESNSAVIKYVK